jgi:hypothetical protein
MHQVASKGHPIYVNGCEYKAHEVAGQGLEP